MNIAKYIAVIFLFIMSFQLIKFKNSSLKFSSQYVNNFASCDDYADRDYEIVGSVRIDNQRNISLLSVKGWIGLESGDFHKIQILDKNQKRAELINIDGWLNIKKSETNPTTVDNYFFCQYSIVKNPYILVLDIGCSSNVMVALGYPDGSEHGFLTIIDLKSDIPTIIFNNKAELLKIVKNKNSNKLRVMIGNYEFAGDEHVDKKGRIIPANPDSVAVYDIYIKNNELVVEDLKLNCEQILDLLDESYNMRDIYKNSNVEK